MAFICFFFFFLGLSLNCSGSAYISWMGANGLSAQVMAFLEGSERVRRICLRNF